MNEEKMLIKQEKQNIFKKMFNDIKNIFFNKKVKKVSNNVEISTENIFIDTFEEQKQLLNLQRKLEKGIIKETDLTEEEKDNLTKLYNRQIEDLKKDINVYNQALKTYKEKIICMQNKLKENN